MAGASPNFIAGCTASISTPGRCSCNNLFLNSLMHGHCHVKCPKSTPSFPQCSQFLFRDMFAALMFFLSHVEPCWTILSMLASFSGKYSNEHVVAATSISKSFSLVVLWLVFARVRACLAILEMFGRSSCMRHSSRSVAGHPCWCSTNP